MRTTQENGTAKHLSSGTDKTAAQQYDGLRRGKLFYTIKEVVATGLCSRQTLWRLMKAGEMGYVKVGTRVLIPREELLDFVRRNYHKGVACRSQALGTDVQPRGDVVLRHALPPFLAGWTPVAPFGVPAGTPMPRRPTQTEQPEINVRPLGGTTLAQAAREGRHP